MNQLTITLFGPLQIAWNGVPVRFAYKKAAALLVYLVLEGRQTHARGALAGLLWPDVPERVARQSLSQALTTLRQALGEHSALSALLLTDADTLQLNPAVSCLSDVARFQELLALSERHTHIAWRTCAECGERLQQAAALDQGELLAQFHLRDSGPFEEWLAHWREQLREQALGLYERLAEWAEWRDDLALALLAVRRQIALDPWAEPAQRELIRLLALNGQTAVALAHYETFTRTLAAEVGLVPEPTTRALAALIQRDPQASRTALRRFAPPPPLPQPPTALVGRTSALQAVVDCLRSATTHALTITGPPGVGKTRLALAAAAALRYDFADGVWFVELAPLTAASQAPLALAQTLGVQERSHEPLTTTLANYLYTRHLLIVLDNFEHLPDLAPFVAALLASCPTLYLLGTSRAPLQIRAERQYPLAPLALPPPAADYAAIAAADAVQLLLARGQDHRPELALTAANAAAFAALCTCLDGLPLAIELVAGSITTLPFAQIVQQFAGQTALGVAGPRDLPDRQQTLRAAIAWSVDRLTLPERKLFATLGVFAGSGSVEALQAIVGETYAVVPHLEALQRQSIVQFQAAAGEQRFTLLETLRTYAQAMLAEQQALDAAQGQLACWLATQAEAAYTGLLGAEGAQWSVRIAADLPNVRNAQRWALDHGARELALRIATGIWRFYWQRGYPREGLAWLRAGLALPAAISPVLEMRALRAAGVLAMGAEEPAEAVAFLTAARNLALREENSAEYGAATTNLGMVLREQGRLEEACALLEEAVQVNRTMTDHPATVKFPLIILAGLYGRTGQIDRAEALYTECLAINRELDDGEGTANALYGLAFVAHARGAYARAQDLSKAAFALYEQLHHQLGMGWVTALFGDIARDRGEVAAALEAYAHSLTIWAACNNQGQASFVLDEAAMLFLRLGAHQPAVTLVSAAKAMRAVAKVELTPAEQARRQNALDAGRAALTELQYVAALATGERLTLTDAVQVCRGP
jgi:predicted ATPase/DNA-binding SARP family transcriptional activator